MSESSPDPRSASRRLGLLTATAIVVANMIGTGVFTTTGHMVLGLESTPILAGWFLGGVLALCGAAVYGELGVTMPRVGGEYVYLKEAFHPAVGFLSGWVSLVVGFSAPIAAAAIAFSKYLGVVFPGAPVKGAAIALIAFTTALHMADVILGSRVQNVLAALKTLLILVFIVAGLLVGSGDWSNLDTALPGASGAMLTAPFWVSLVYVSFSYSGWNAAAYLAGELDDPGRTLPRALFLGTAIVTVLYLGLNLVFLYAAPAAELAGKEEVGAVAASHLFGERAARWLSTLIFLGLMSSVSAMVMAGPRVYTAMAEDGLFFQFLARRNRRGAPVFSVLLQGLLAMVFVLAVPFDALVRYIGFTLSIFTALTVLGAGVLRARQAAQVSAAPPTGLAGRVAAVARTFLVRSSPGLDTRGYRAVGWPVTPLLFLALSLWMVVFLIRERPVATLLGGGSTVILGSIVYLLWRTLGSRRAR